MRFFVFSLATLLIATQSTYGDIVMKCQWMVKTRITIEKSKQDNVEKKRFRKELFSTSPKNCVEFQYNNYGIKDLTKEQWSELSEAYERPAKIKLNCPQGYTPANGISWALTSGLTRQHTYQTYYLDTYISELPCIKETIPKI